MAEEEETAFQRLKPICVSLTRRYETDTLNALRITCEKLDTDVFQKLQEYVIFPCRIHLRNENDETVIIECIDFMAFVFCRTKVSSWFMFSDIMAKLFEYVGSVPSSANSSSEELKLSVCRCVKTLVANTSDNIRSNIYGGEDFHLRLAQYIYCLLEVIKKEKSRVLRCAAVKALSEILYCSKMTDDEKISKMAGDRLAAFLPGVCIGIQMIICGDVKQGHTVIVTAIELFSKFIVLEMSDEYITDKRTSSKKNQNLNLPPSVDRNVQWAKATSKKLEVIIRNISDLVSHEHLKVRMSITDCAKNLLCRCSRNLDNCVSPLLQTLFALTNDEYQEVAVAAKNAIDSFSRNADTKSLDHILEEDVLSVCSRLTKIHLIADDKRKLTVIKSVLGYLELLGTSVNKLLYSPPHLDRFLMSILNFVRFDVRDIYMLEEVLPTMDFLSFSAEIWPPKHFMHFRDGEIVSKIKSICMILGQNGDLNLLVDHLLAKMDNGEYQNEALFVITYIIHSGETIDDLSESKVQAINMVMQTLLSFENQSDSINDPGGSIEKHNRDVLNTCLVLECVAVCSRVLGQRFRLLLMDVLCPVLECAGSENLAVSQSGKVCLYVITSSCGYESVTELVSENSDYLINSITLTLRYFLHKPETARVIRVILEQCDSDKVLFLFRDPIGRLLRTLDLNQEKALFVMPIFLSVVRAVAKWQHPSVVKMPVVSHSEREEPQPSLEESLLEHIRLKRLSENFEESIVTDEQLQDNDNTIPDEEEEVVPKLSLHAELVINILDRCAHMISSQNQELCMLCLEIVGLSVRALGEEVDKIHPSIHKIWTPLVQRFSDNVIISSKAFETLVIIAEGCGDFIRSRTIKEVWPKLISLLDNNSSLGRSKTGRLQTTNKYKYLILVLSKIGTLAKTLDLTEKKFETILRCCLRYLERDQPGALRDAAVISVDILASIHPDAFWFHFNELYGSEKEISSQNCDLRTVNFFSNHPNLISYTPRV